MDGFAGHNAGGLYRVIYGDPAAPSAGDAATEAPVPYDMSSTSLGGVIGSNGGAVGSANFSLERLAVLPCARQMTVSPSSRLLFVSTLKEFCAHSPSIGETDLDKGAIWAVELSPSTGRVQRKAMLVQQLLDPQGIDYANGTLYIATSGRGKKSEGRGNCVLRIPDVDALAMSVLADPAASLPFDDARVEDVNCSFTTIQPAGHSRGHAWRSLRVEPSGKRAYVQVGSDCNWQADCVPSDVNAHTNFLAFDVVEGSETFGGVMVVGNGIRNAVGMWFDRNGNLLWIDNGSDDEEVRRLNRSDNPPRLIATFR